MSQENVEVVKRVAEAWNRDDLDAFIDLLDPEVEWYPASGASFEGRESASSQLAALWIGGTVVRHGHAGVRKGWESYSGERVESLEVRLDEIRDLGESVLALGEMKISGQTSRLELTSEIALLCTFRYGRIVTGQDFMSHAEGLEAAGLRNQEPPV
jgi:ketosteroid isomerase-like protein